MRDPNRIHKFCVALEQMWLSAPDLRFGQIIGNAMRLAGIFDSFFVEDDEMLKHIRAFFAEFHK